MKGDKQIIGLIDADKNRYPNLALMKISAYHKSIGNKVVWANIGSYDITYISKVFSYTYFRTGLGNYGKIILGGTGFNNFDNLPDEIDNKSPDYSIYPHTNKAYGFLTRGCPNKCSWCIVPRKEGNIRPYSDIEDFIQDRKEAILMDNNVLAHNHGLTQIEKIIKLGIKIDFNQGLDARIIAGNVEIAQLLSRVKWISQLRMACDTESQIPYIDRALTNLNKYGFKNYKVFVYVLVKDIDSAYKRVEFLRRKGCDPFAQPYRDYENDKLPSRQQLRFARWVNHKAIFKFVKWENYK